MAASGALAWLEAHPKARNLAMSVCADRIPAYTTKQVLDAHVGPHAQDGFNPVCQMRMAMHEAYFLLQLCLLLLKIEPCRF